MNAWLETTASPRLARSHVSIAAVRSAWLKGAGRKWIELDGRRMRDWSSTHDHLTEAFGLPDYFGRNLNALSECLVDQDVLQGTAFVICITHVSDALRHANSDALAGLLETFSDVADELAEPVVGGNDWDRPPIPFHVLLVGGDDDERLRDYPSASGAAPQSSGG